MRRIFAGIALLLILVSCENKKAKINPFAAITREVDSMLHRKKAVDTLNRETATEEEPKPIEADESFYDFIYSFASDDALQRQRIVFPLPYYNGDAPSRIERKDWKHDSLFITQDYYTLLLDKEEDLEKLGINELTSIQLEWIFIRSRKIKKYYFERVKGSWMLEAINLRPAEKGEGENFLDFYGRFASDSLFQCQRVRTPLKFFTADPDDDFSVLETTLDLNQWLAFKPELPSNKLTNINYGQENRDNSPTKILALKGIGNSFSNILYFQRRNGEWELYKFEDISM